MRYPKKCLTVCAAVTILLAATGGQAFADTLVSAPPAAAGSSGISTLPAVVSPPSVSTLPAVVSPPSISTLPAVVGPPSGLSVDGRTLDAPLPYLNADGILMVPVRAAAEALGEIVTWEAKTGSVFVGATISFGIGKNTYNYMRMAPVSLDAAPALSGGYSYVPLSFFTEIMRLDAVYTPDGRVVIDRPEIAEPAAQN